MNIDPKQYYNMGRLPQLLHVSKKTFYSHVVLMENFPEIIEWTPNFKWVKNMNLKPLPSGIRTSISRRKKEGLIDDRVD